MIEKQNLLDQIPQDLSQELFEHLAHGEGRFRIERIVSRGHSSELDFWYDQNSTEWVVLIQGSAQLEFSEPSQTVDLVPGDSIKIPPHKRHRVNATAKDTDTIWLAVHWEDSAPSK